MSEISPAQANTLNDLLAGICPGLALSMAEQVNREVTLEPIQVQEVAIPEILGRPETVFSTVFSLTAPMNGENLISFSRETATILADLLGGGDGTAPPLSLSDAQTDALSEFGAAMARGFATALGNLMGEMLEVEGNSASVGAIQLPPTFAMANTAVEARIALSLAELDDAEIAFFFTPKLVQRLIPEEEPSVALEMESEPGAIGEDELAAMLSELESLGSPGGFGAESAPGFAPTAAAPNPFNAFATPEPDSLMPRGMGLILDIPLDVTVELGRVRMLIKDVLELASGSIVELERVAGEPLDLLVNGKLVAKGEVVVIEDNFGIRITEIISPAERVAGLGKER